MTQAVLHPEVAVKPRTRLHYAATTFISAFLLFQVQPVIGKYVLPWFGGTASVWTTCMLFFQLLLLGGYLYSHSLSTRLTPKIQALVHTGSLMLAAVVILVDTLFWKTPLLPGPSWKPLAPQYPMAHLLLLLTLAVGLPYLLLSSTGPLLQNWFGLTYGRSPYRLYALSNVGSLLGLISYPVLFEPVFGLRIQAWIWCAGYAFFMAGSAWCAWRIRKPARAAQENKPESVAAAESGARPSPGTQLFWSLLAAMPSLMLLATTNLICQEVAVIPFLWVLPLSLYLVTLIVCFDNSKWYRREIFQTLLGLVLPFAALAFLNVSGPSKPDLYRIAVFCAVLFTCCMVCHGELVRLRPETAHLTRFYLVVAAGGAAGAVFVALIAPRIFSGYWEFQAGLVGSLLLIMSVLMREKSSWWYWPPPVLGGLIFVGIGLTPHIYVRYLKMQVLPDAFYTFHYYGLFTCLLVGVGALYLWQRKKPVTYRKFNLAQMASLVVVVGLSAFLWRQLVLLRKGELRRDRNFYGSLTIYSRDGGRMLAHGQTLHGYQLLDDPHKPTVYFGHASGIGLLMDARPPCQGPCRLRYGLIGMGVGTLATYGREGEVMRYYEINPQVIEYSRSSSPYFTFIRDSAAHLEVVPGDARLSLERELKESGPAAFDLLVVDAFNSDSIPVHLLTQEAMQVYLAHLRSRNSIVAIHISNRTLDLRPVLVGLALRNHLSYVRLNRLKSFIFEEVSDWVLMSRNPDVLAIPSFQRLKAPMPPSSKAVLWTDDYTNLVQLLKFHEE